jgi:hypothetical protein
LEKMSSLILFAIAPLRKKRRPLEGKLSAKVTETVAKTTTLLSYEEISDIFRQQMNRCLYGEGAEMTVTAVKLGLFRIREQNSMETGLLVPAWVITGRLTTSDGGQPAACRQRDRRQHHRRQQRILKLKPQAKEKSPANAGLLCGWITSRRLSKPT